MGPIGYLLRSRRAGSIPGRDGVLEQPLRVRHVEAQVTRAGIPRAWIGGRPGVRAVVLQELHEDAVTAGHPEVHDATVAHLDAHEGAHVVDRVDRDVEVDLHAQQVPVERQRPLHVAHRDAAVEESRDP